MIIKNQIFFGDYTIVLFCLKEHLGRDKNLILRLNKLMEAYALIMMITISELSH